MQIAERKGSYCRRFSRKIRRRWTTALQDPPHNNDDNYYLNALGKRWSITRALFEIIVLGRVCAMYNLFSGYNIAAADGGSDTMKNKRHMVAARRGSRVRCVGSRRLRVVTNRRRAGFVFIVDGKALPSPITGTRPSAAAWFKSGSLCMYTLAFYNSWRTRGGGAAARPDRFSLLVHGSYRAESVRDVR